MYSVENIVIAERTPEDVIPVMRSYSAKWFIVEAEQSGVPREAAMIQAASWGTDEERLPLWTNGMADPNYDVVTVRENDLLVGFFSGVKTMEDTTNTARINRIHLDRRLWGQAVGTILIKRFHDIVGAEKDIYLEVLEGNERAISLYQKLGYDFTGKSSEVVFADYETRRLEMKRKRKNDKGLAT